MCFLMEMLFQPLFDPQMDLAISSAHGLSQFFILCEFHLIADFETDLYGISKQSFITYLIVFILN